MNTTYPSSFGPVEQIQLYVIVPVVYIIPAGLTTGFKYDALPVEILLCSLFFTSIKIPCLFI